MLTYIPDTPRCGFWIGLNLLKGAALQIFLKEETLALNGGCSEASFSVESLSQM